MTWTKPTQTKLNHDKPKKDKKVQFTKDKGWAWVVAICCCFGVSLSVSIVCSVGILYTAMIDELQFDFMSVTIIGSTHTALSTAGAVFAVPFVERFGIRPVILTSGIIMSSGCLLAAFVTSYSLLLFCLGVIPGCASAFAFIAFFIGCDHYFEEKKAIALTIVSCGYSLSVVIFPQFIKLTIDSYGFHGSLIMLSGIILNICACGAVILPIKENGRSTDGTASASTSQRVDFKFLTRPGYIVYLISNVLLMSGLFLPLIFLPETIQAKGLSSGVVNLVFLINGICQIVGRLFSGFCSSRKPLYATFIWSMYLIITGISLVMVPFCTQLGHFLAFSLISGFLMGGALVGMNLALRNLVDDRYFGRAFSITLLAGGIGGLFGSPLAASIQKMTSDATTPYYFGCMAFVLGGLILLPFSKATVKIPTEVVLDVEQNCYKLYHISVESVGENNILYERALGTHEIPIT